MQQLEIEVNRRGCYILGIVILAIAATVIGYQVSPRVKGRPVLLTAENYAIKRYLDRAEGWAEAMAREQARLASLGSRQASPSGAAPAPVSRPGDIFSRAHEAQDAQGRLDAVWREMEREEVPPSLKGLHTLAVDAVQAQLGLADTTLNTIGAPSAVEPAEVTARLEQAEDLLHSLQKALAAQRQAMEE
jgi:hypothetical protein